MANKTINLPILLAEFIGTLIYGYGTCTSKSEPFAVAGCLYIAMAFTGYMSTPQFNPAVTVSIMLRKLIHKDLNMQDLLQYSLNMCVQFLAAFIAAGLSWLTSHNAFYYTIQPAYNNNEGFFAEVTYTAIICATCLTVKKVTHSLLLSGIAISTAYLVGNLAVNTISFACFNPAFGLMFNAVRYIKDEDHFDNTWIFVIGPFFGALIGTTVAVLFMNYEDEEESINRTLSLEGKIEH